MKKIIVDEKMYVVFDESTWDVLENFQGNNVTFVKRDNSNNTSVPTVSILRKKGVSKNVDVVYRHTSRELRRFLNEYEDKVLETDLDSMWFVYSGLFEDKRMKFSQKISVEEGVLSSITWGTSHEDFDDCTELFESLLSGVCKEER